MADNLAETLRLLLVTDDDLVAPADLLRVAGQAVRGGATAIQVRYKRLTDRDLLDLTRALVATLPVAVFVNDRLDIALAAGAAGVHLGPDDIAPGLARRIAPPGFVIGASVGAESEVDRAAAADYWGIGPLHGTATKGDAGAALGLDGAASLRQLAGDRPAVLIGGVRPEDVPGALSSGFTGVAVASGILGAADVTMAASRYRA